MVGVSQHFEAKEQIWRVGARVYRWNLRRLPCELFHGWKAWEKRRSFAALLSIFLNYIIKSSLASLPRESFPKKYKTLFFPPRFQNPPLLLILAISFSTTHLSHSLWVIIIKLKERQPTLPKQVTSYNSIIQRVSRNV